jgi:hypothetical protein
MRGFTGMISIELGSLERATRVVQATRLFALAESLGGVESLIGHPAIMTHASVPEEMRRRMGISDGLVRLSVGIEDVETCCRTWRTRSRRAERSGRRREGPGPETRLRPCARRDRRASPSFLEPA